MLPAAVLAVVALVPLTVLLSTVLVLGWQLQVIETASMEPRISAGSLAVVEPIDAADVRVGMTIVFEDPSSRDRLVAHRAVGRLPGKRLLWTTQGDANRAPDAYPVSASAIQGRVRWTVPHLGSIASALHTRVTAVALIGLPIALLVVTEIAVTLRRRRRPPSVAILGSTVYAVREALAGADHTSGAFVDVFARREDAEAFVTVASSDARSFRTLARRRADARREPR